MGLISTLMAIAQAATPEDKPAGKEHHLPDGTFRNNAQLENHGDAWKFLRWRWEREEVEPQAFPIAENDPVYLQQNQTDSTLTWIGHSTFLIQHKGLNILTDPHLTGRASPFSFAGPKRFTPPGLDFSELPAIDAVVISHDHYDHLDLATVTRLARQQPSPLFIVPLKVGDWLSEQGIDNWVQLDWWEQTQFRGWTFTAVPVQHFSGRTLLKRNDTLWAGWVLQPPVEQGEESENLFFAGDTGYSADFVEIGRRFGHMNLSLLPIGAYEPRWFMRDMHINPEEAVQIHKDVGSRFSVGMHWGTFVLTDEPMSEPPERLLAEVKKQGLAEDEFVCLRHGETRSLREAL